MPGCTRPSPGHTSTSFAHSRLCPAVPAHRPAIPAYRLVIPGYARPYPPIARSYLHIVWPYQAMSDHTRSSPGYARSYQHIAWNIPDRSLRPTCTKRSPPHHITTKDPNLQHFRQHAKRAPKQACKSLITPIRHLFCHAIRARARCASASTQLDLRLNYLQFVISSQPDRISTRKLSVSLRPFTKYFSKAIIKRLISCSYMFYLIICFIKHYEF